MSQYQDDIANFILKHHSADDVIEQADNVIHRDQQEVLTLRDLAEFLGSLTLRYGPKCEGKPLKNLILLRFNKALSHIAS